VRNAGKNVVRTCPGANPIAQISTSMVLYAKITITLVFSMLRIGKLTDYAMLILSQMAKDPDSILSATAIAEALRLTVPTVSKILKILSEAQLVTSVRGAIGGYRLMRSAENITIAQVIVAMEGDLALTECCELTSQCIIDASCTMRENWKKINWLVSSILSKITILDMMRPTFSPEMILALGAKNDK